MDNERPEWKSPVPGDVAKSYLATLEREGGDCGAYIRQIEGSEIPLHLGYEVEALGELLGFCGCGMPEEALYAAGDILAFFETHLASTPRPYEQTLKMRAEAFRTTDEAAQYLMAYALDHKGLEEHGSGIMNGWLTDLGKGVLADIRRLRAEEK